MAALLENGKHREVKKGVQSLIGLLRGRIVLNLEMKKHEEVKADLVKMDELTAELKVPSLRLVYDYCKVTTDID